MTDWVIAKPNTTRMGYYNSLLLLILLTSCAAKPVENENITFKNEINTTPCPEELAKQKLEAVKEEMISKDQSSDRFEQTTAETGTTTPCPEELNTLDANSVQNTLNDLEETLLELSENADGSGSSEEHNEGNTETSATKLDETTTICPEELAKIKLKNSEKKEEQDIKKLPVTPNEISSNILPDSSSKNKNKLNANHNDIILTKQNTHQMSTETSANSEKQDKINQESEKRFENAFNQLDKSETTETEESGGTTICPEELLQKQKVDSQTIDLKENSPQNKEQFQNNAKVNKNENNDASTTIYPEEATKLEEESENNEISVKTLLSVQKDSALLKLVKDKLQLANVRSKRQTSSYSPYYINKPTYTSEGIALSPDDARQNNQNYNANEPAYPTNQNNQKSRVSSQQNYQKTPVSYNNVKTYQQIQRQYQNAYPQSYQNYVKQVKNYQSPNPYARYTNNGNIKNYYKTKNSASRRQYQSGARPFTTTARTRPTVKKFRPSPVFA